MNKKPRICAVGMFQKIYDIQLQSLINVFSMKGIKSIQTTHYQNKILKFLDISFFLFVNKNKYDVIHMQAHSHFNIISVILAIFWAKILKKKIIVMYYGGAAKEFFSIAPKYFRVMFSQVNEIVVAGNYIQTVFSDLKISTTIIPHVINVYKWPYRHRVLSENHLLWVRHLTKEYNPLMLVKVFNKLNLKVPGMKLKIVGTGDLQNEMEKYISTNSLNGIKILGRVSDTELKSLLNWADIFINTTNVDNQPVSVLEAMICGCPVVSTNPGGIPNIITHRENGLLSDPGDIDAMVENILLLFKDKKLYSNLSRRGRKYVKNTFGEEIIYKQWSKVYARLGFIL